MYAVINRFASGPDPGPALPGAEPPAAASPRIVMNTGTQRPSRRRFLGGAVGLAALGSFAVACGSAGNQPQSSRASGGRATTVATTSVDADLVKQRYLGLKPFSSPPPPPPVKPVTLSAADPAVFSRVPLTDKVVFVTIDDGIEKDPKFIQMVRDFQVPITISLADVLIRDDYAYFEKLYETGYVSIQNHTVTHPLDMPALSATQQLDEIAGQQEKLNREYGVTPYIFRPPGGNYNETTITSASQAGLKGVMLWKEAMQITDMQYQTSVHRLSPGDVILCHFRGPAQLKGESMVHMMIHLYRRIQAQGFTVADITKYV